MSTTRYNNYYEGPNPFKLSGPPEHFLRGLYEFDRSLVVIPSKQGFFYRLAQKRPLSLSADIVNQALFKESDTQMLASYGLIPVTTILSTANWSNPLLFEELRNRAPWRLGGAKNVIETVEGREFQNEVRVREQNSEMLDYTGKEAWKYYKTKIGTRGTFDLGKL